jgi:hypothetical protein
VSKTLLTAVMIRRLKLVSIDVVDCSMLALIDKLNPITHVAYLGSDSSLEEHCLILYVNYESHIQNEALHEHFCLCLIPSEQIQQYKNEEYHQAGTESKIPHVAYYGRQYRHAN